MNNDKLILESIYEKMIQEALIVGKVRSTTDPEKFYIAIGSDTNDPKDTLSNKDKIKNSKLFKWDGNIKRWVSWKSFTEEEIKNKDIINQYRKAILSLNKQEAGAAPLNYEEMSDELEVFLDEGFTEKIKKYLDELKERLKNNPDSPEIKAFQEFSSKFRKYSFRNRMLIWLQKRDATNVASATDWKNKFGRIIKKGEKGITIFRPNIGKDKEIVDPTSGQVSVERGKTFFSTANVFDISQTQPIEGKEHLTAEEPKWFDDTTVDEKTKAIYDALLNYAKEKGIEVTVGGEEGEKLGSARGSSSLNKINLKDNNLSTLIHELAHEILHTKEIRSGQEKIKTQEGEEVRGDLRQLLELEAEGVAYTVLSYYGLPVGHTETYLRLWKIDPDQIDKHEDRIRSTAKDFINYIDSFETESEPEEVAQESFKNFFNRRTLNENTENAQSTYKVKDKDKKMIGKAFEEAGLDGNGRFGNPSKGIAAVAKALHSVGFELDMVSGDLLLGANGQRNLSYRKYDQSTGTFDEHPAVTNSLIAFNWHYEGKDHNDDPMYEIQCYPS